jgi:hypothetical protein
VFTGHHDPISSSSQWLSRDHRFLVILCNTSTSAPHKDAGSNGKVISDIVSPALPHYGFVQVVHNTALTFSFQVSSRNFNPRVFLPLKVLASRYRKPLCYAGCIYRAGTSTGAFNKHGSLNHKFKKKVILHVITTFNVAHLFHQIISFFMLIS